MSYEGLLYNAWFSVRSFIAQSQSRLLTDGDPGLPMYIRISEYCCTTVGSIDRVVGAPFPILVLRWRGCVKLRSWSDRANRSVGVVCSSHVFASLACNSEYRFLSNANSFSMCLYHLATQCCPCACQRNVLRRCEAPCGIVQPSFPIHGFGFPGDGLRVQIPQTCVVDCP